MTPETPAAQATGGPPTLAIDGPVATITLARPDLANRLGPDDLVMLQAHLRAVDARDDVRVLRLAATGRHFCSGYDIHRIGTGRAVSFEDVADAVEAARPVTIAAIQGGVYGGATDLILACDFRVGTTAADFFMPAARLGLHYYPHGLERYVSRLGVDVAKRLFLTAERIGAEEMKAIGCLTHLVAPAELSGAVDGLSATLAAMAPIPLLGMKKHLNRIARGTLDADALQRDIDRAAASSDLIEGRTAWQQRRPPRFTGT